MTDRNDVTRTLPWLREGTAHLLARVETLTDDDLRAPSALPGWTRAHVVGHLARNAEAIGRLARWARTGVETPMYTGPDQRATDIERSATWPGPALRAGAADTARDLDDALGALDDRAWEATVRSGQGRTIRAAEIVWMRVREVWLHAVDLDPVGPSTGAGLQRLPDDGVDLLLDDVTATLSGRDGCPALVLVATDRDRRWELGPPGGPEIIAPAAALAGWATGRAPLDAPTPPRWL